MSQEERTACDYFIQWIEQGGLTQWIEHFLNQGDEPKLNQIKEIYIRIKALFGF